MNNTILCKNCKKEFPLLDMRKKYCSENCKNESIKHNGTKRKRETRVKDAYVNEPVVATDLTVKTREPIPLQIKGISRRNLQNMLNALVLDNIFACALAVSMCAQIYELNKVLCKSIL
jgi:hypothetical protein